MIQDILSLASIRLIALARMARLGTLKRKPAAAEHHDTARKFCMEHFPYFDAGFSTDVKSRRQLVVIYRAFRGILLLR